MKGRWPNNQQMLEELQRLASCVSKCQKRHAIYRAHLKADMHQSKFRGKILAKLQTEWSHVYGIHDYWQKVLSQLHKEMSSDHFGKRGISVHGSIWFIPIPPPGAKGEDGQLIDRSRFDQVESGFDDGYIFDCNDFVIECHHFVCDDASQGSWHGISCQEASRKVLHARWPHINGSYDNSDNGCHYHAVMNFAHLSAVASMAGVPVLQWPFFLPGMGENMGDTDGATNKHALLVYVDEGGNIEIARHVVIALDKNRVSGAINAEIGIDRGELEAKVRDAMKPLAGLQGAYSWTFNADGSAVLRRFHELGHPVAFTRDDMSKLAGEVDLSQSGTGVRLLTSEQSLAAERAQPRHAVSRGKKRQQQQQKAATRMAKKAKQLVEAAAHDNADTVVRSNASVVPQQASGPVVCAHRAPECVVCRNRTMANVLHRIVLSALRLLAARKTAATTCRLLARGRSQACTVTA